MISYDNKELKYEGCPGCAYARGDFSLSCGKIYQNNNFTVSQDWELPIEGFIIISPIRCVEKLCELTEEEQIEMIKLTNKTINLLRKNEICDRYDVIFEEKENRHLHVWLMPRHQWMENIKGDIIDNIGEILSYAKSNLKTSETFKRINEISDMLRKDFLLEKKTSFNYRR